MFKQCYKVSNISQALCSKSEFWVDLGWLRWRSQYRCFSEQIIMNNCQSKINCKALKGRVQCQPSSTFYFLKKGSQKKQNQKSTWCNYFKVFCNVFIQCLFNVHSMLYIQYVFNIQWLKMDSKAYFFSGLWPPPEPPTQPL